MKDKWRFIALQAVLILISLLDFEYSYGGIFKEPEASVLVSDDLRKQAMMEVQTQQKSMVDSLVHLSDSCREKQNYSQALAYSEQALDAAKESGDTLLLLKTYRKQGVMQYIFFQPKESEKNLSKAIHLSKILFSQNKISAHRLIISYFDMVLQFKRFERYSNALQYLDSCYMISDTSNLHPIDQAYLDAETGFLLVNLDQSEKATSYLVSSIAVFEGIDKTGEREKERGYLAVLYSYLGEAFRQNGELKKSEKYFNDALEVLKTNKRHIDQKPYILEHLAWLKYEMDEYERAFELLNESYVISENYFSAKTLTKDEFLTVRNNYQSERSKRLQKLIINSLELAEKDKSISRLRIMVFSVIFILVLISFALLIKSLTKKHRKEKKEAKEKEIRNKELIKIKNKELTVSTLQLIEKDSIIKQLSDELAKFKDGNVLTNFSYNSNSLWEDFNSRFIAVNEDFYERLNARVTGLSANDLKICALIKLNFSTKEMAHLLGISYDSVQKARHRLRKKLNLDRQVNLTSFISSI